MNDQNVSLSLSRFLLIEHCPVEWKRLDLYLFRDDAVVFYVGQSYLAFARVWEHLKNGFKGHSMIGRFIWCNWPVSMKFTIELLSSQFEQFDILGNHVTAAERELIRRWSPCLMCHRTGSQRLCHPSMYCPMRNYDAVAVSTS
jgi:hypothetical protein